MIDYYGSRTFLTILDTLEKWKLFLPGNRLTIAAYELYRAVSASLDYVDIMIDHYDLSEIKTPIDEYGPYNMGVTQDT